MKILLAKIREEKEMTLKEVAILTGLKLSTVHDIEIGKSSPRMNQMEKLAKGLNCRISDLYESDFK